MAQTVTYTDDYIQASEYLRLVLAFLARHQIPPSPLNYQIAYEFISGNNTALTTELDTRLEKSADISEQTLLNLYQQYIVQDDGSLDYIREELKKIISSIQNEYDDSNINLSEYAKSLSSFSTILSASKNQGILATETQKVMQNTQSTEQSQRKFESQMSGMMEEIETLRKQLKQVREESLTDALTGIANRKFFDERLAQAVQQNEQEKLPFCLVLADIDHFKKFNDSYGHLVGDKVLRYVGKTLLSCVKGKDMAARFGGEEFALILPDTELTGAAIVAEQVRKAICKSLLSDHRTNRQYGKITISLGVGQIQHSEQEKDLIHRVDQALYQAKEQGRNRVQKAL